MIFEEWLMERVTFEPNTGCWLWLGHVQTKGYAQATIDGRLCLVNRVVLGILDAGPRIMALHRCDQPSCVNERHLYRGTARDNALDMVRKNRSYLAKLTTDQVAGIRSLLGAGVGIMSVAAMYSMTYSAIDAIRRNRNWKQTSER